MINQGSLKMDVELGLLTIQTPVFPPLPGERDGT